MLPPLLEALGHLVIAWHIGNVSNAGHGDGALQQLSHQLRDVGWLERLDGAHELGDRLPTGTPSAQRLINDKGAW